MLRDLSKKIGKLLVVFCILLISFGPQSAQAELALHADTNPGTLSYQGRLTNSGGTALSTEHTLRFSFWSDGDHDGTDRNEDGSIKISATGYADWQEEQTVTPDSNGLFSIQLGTLTPLPNFNFNTHKYLQIEVKASGQADTAYEVLDPNTSDVIDRKAINAAPFALNAETLDGYDIGTGSGSIALLRDDGKWAPGQIPGGTEESVFTIDYQGASATPTLQFGDNINNYIRWSSSENRFEVSDDVYIAGNLTVAGTLAANIEVSGTTEDVFQINSDGDATTEDTSLRFGSNLSETLMWDASKSMFVLSDDLEISGALTVNGAGVLSGTIGNANIASDAAIDWSKMATRDKSIPFSVEYPDAGYKPDGSNNIGILSVEEDVINKRLYYSWASTETSLNDYVVQVRVQVPNDFTTWQATAISLNYNTSSASQANNEIDITVYDTAGNAVSTTNGTDLYSASWSTTNIGFSDGTFIPGSYFTIEIKLFAKDGNSANVSDMTLNYAGR